MGKGDFKKKYHAKNGIISGNNLENTLNLEKPGFGPEVAVEDTEANSINEIIDKLHNVKGGMKNNRKELNKWARPNAFWRFKIHRIGRVYEWVRNRFILLYGSYNCSNYILNELK